MPTSIYTSKDKDHSEKPLKLMIKKHMLVGIKYLCKTIRENHDAYSGSGTRWNNILNKYGKDHVRTRVIFTTHSKSEFKRVGLLLSEQWDIVDSNDWANLVPENGDGGGGVIGGKMPPRTEQWKARQRAAKIGKPGATKNKKLSKEHVEKLRTAQTGKKHSEETKARIGASLKGRKHSEEAKAVISASTKKQKRDSNGRFIKKETT